jgi:hypothetical protein
MRTSKLIKFKLYVKRNNIKDDKTDASIIRNKEETVNIRNEMNK